MEMDSDLVGDVCRRFVTDRLSSPDLYPEDMVNLAEDMDNVLNQNQKLIEALMKIAGRKGPRNLNGDEMFQIAQQALDEVDAQKD